MSDTATVTADAVPEEQGKRSRRVFQLKMFADPEWIMKNIVSQGKGTHVSLGRVYGIAHATERRVNDIKGVPTPSVSIIGRFEAENFSTGEFSAASTLYLPMGFAEQIEAVFKEDKDAVVKVDVDIGVEATGKTIPYEWTVTSYVEQAESSELLALRARRVPKARKVAQPSLPAPAPQAQIAAPTSEFELTAPPAELSEDHGSKKKSSK